ncbi:MAG: hypothetical protein ABF289_14720 [Clostridiales bacterium]
MDFLTATVLSGVAWDLIKHGGSLTSSKLKNSLKNWILKDEDYEIITKKINDAPETFKKNQNYLEIFLKEDGQIKEILSHAKSNVTNQVNFENNTFNNSPQTVTNNGTQNFNYNKVDKEEKDFSNNNGQINISSGNSKIDAKIVKDH